MRQVMEVAAYWGGELFSIDYVSPRTRLDFPEALEVRTRLVDAAPRMPRAPMDVPYLAIATIAACAHAFGMTSLVTNDDAVSRDLVFADRFVLVASTETDSIGVGSGTGGPARDDVAPAARLELGDDVTGSDSVSLDEARSFGMIGLLHDHLGDPTTTAWAPPPSGDGALWGDAIGDAFGTPGLSLSGVGEGGGGNGLGNVLDRVRTENVATGHGHLGGSHTSGFHCTLRCVGPIIVDRLPSESIRRVVQENVGRFRNCYEKGLARDPKLAGRVSTKFVIARDGTVAAVADGGSDLSDAEVVACIQRTFSSLEFPESPSGVVSVIYPFELSPVD